MIIAIDIGNSSIAAGCIEDGKILIRGHFTTRRNATAEEYAITLQSWLNLQHVAASAIDGGIIASVVPTATSVIAEAVRMLIHKTPLIVGPGIRSGLNIKIDNPAQLGADLVVGAVAAGMKYPFPQIIFDMGTATTVSVIDKNGAFRGAVITAGVYTSLAALTDRTSQLTSVELCAPRSLIGKNTDDSMKAGAIYGTASMMDGLAQRIQEELGQKASLIATGSPASAILPFCKEKFIYDETLILDGLWMIYQKNMG